MDSQADKLHSTDGRQPTAMELVGLAPTGHALRSFAITWPGLPLAVVTAASADGLDSYVRSLPAHLGRKVLARGSPWRLRDGSVARPLLLSGEGDICIGSAPIRGCHLERADGALIEYRPEDFLCGLLVDFLAHCGRWASGVGVAPPADVAVDQGFGAWSATLLGLKQADSVLRLTLGGWVDHWPAWRAVGPVAHVYWHPARSSSELIDAWLTTWALPRAG